VIRRSADLGTRGPEAEGSGSDAALAEDVDRLKIDGVDVPVFDAARTIVDCFRFRSKIGLDVVLEPLRDASACRHLAGWRSWNSAS